MGYFSNAGAFLIQTLFGLYILLVMLRFLLQWVRADFYNPLSQFIVKVTNPPLLPLRRMVPGFGGLDSAALVLMLLLKYAELLLLSLLPGHSLPNLLGLGVLTLVELLSLGLNVFLFGIFIQAILSWIGNAGYNPVASLLYQLTAPVLRPFRNLIPPISGMDLSPMAAIIALYLAMLLIIAPLQDLARGLAYGMRPLLGH